MFDTQSLKINKYGYQPTDYLVKSKSATKNEYFVAQAFDFLQLEFLFQVSYWGGKSMVGGQVLDFLVFTPRALPVQVYGDYWHRGQMSNKDRYNEIQIQMMTGIAPVIIWGSESETFEDALAVVKRKVI